MSAGGSSASSSEQPGEKIARNLAHNFFKFPIWKKSQRCSLVKAVAAIASRERSAILLIMTMSADPEPPEEPAIFGSGDEKVRSTSSSSTISDRQHGSFDLLGVQGRVK